VRGDDRVAERERQRGPCARRLHPDEDRARHPRSDGAEREDRERIERREDHVVVARLLHRRGRQTDEEQPVRYLSEHRRRRDVGLDLDVDDASAHRVEHLDEPRDPETRLDAWQVRIRHLVDGSHVGAARRSLERRVVEDDRDAVRRETHVELDAVGALVDRAHKGLERVLRRPALTATAPMTENDDSAQVASSSAISFISLRARSIWSAGSEMAPTTGCPPPP
jgi:hypothetical protein